MESAKLFVTFSLLGILTTFLHLQNHDAARVPIRQILSFQDSGKNLKTPLRNNLEDEPRICTTTMLHELAESADPKVRCVVNLNGSPKLL